jgi:hypothetical protein
MLRLVTCIAYARWPVVLKFGLIVAASAAFAVGWAIIFVRTFRAEVADRDAAREKYRDRDAPPWAQQ